MASIKLVNGNPHHLHHHSLYHHHHHQHLPFLHHPLSLVNPPSPSSPPCPSPVPPGHPTTATSTTTAAAEMTLDYSLPNRSRLGDADPQGDSTLTLTTTTNDNVHDHPIGHKDDGHRTSDITPKCHLSENHVHRDSLNESDSINRNNNSSNSNKYSSANVVKPTSLSPKPSSVSVGFENPEPQSALDNNTPTKKNKRKLSEPRKLRSDIEQGDESGVVSPSSPSQQTEGVNSPADARSSDSGDEDTHSPAIKIPKFSSHAAPVSSSLPRQSLTKQKSSRRHKQPSPSNNEHFLSSTPPPSASSSSPSSSSSPQITQSSTTHPDNDNPTPAIPNGLQQQPPPSFLHPFLSAVPPAAFGLVPGLYLPGQPYPPSALPTAFPGIPLHLQQSYFAAAAAAAAAQSSSSRPSASSPPPSTSAQPHCSSTSSTSRLSETLESSQLQKHRKSSSSHPVILQPPQIHTNHQHHNLSRKSPHSASGSVDSGGAGCNSSNSVAGGRKSTTPSLMSRIPQQSLPQSQSSSTLSSSHFHEGAAQSSSSIDNQINDEDDDDDDDGASSSRVHSPEDLSTGGKMSRKHRKNYKNMTRERRVEANARERTRVHTISAAFDALRRAVPSYSYNQKLSKLAILRIACSYIMSLARLADLDYTSASEHIQRPLTFAECVDMCTNTIQTEGRARRRH